MNYFRYEFRFPFLLVHVNVCHRNKTLNQITNFQQIQYEMRIITGDSTLQLF